LPTFRPQRSCAPPGRERDRGDCAYESPRKPCPLREGSNAPKAVGRSHYGIRHDKPVRRGEGPKNEYKGWSNCYGVSHLGVLAFWPCLFPATVCSANPPRTTLLWPGGAPGALGTRDSDKPALDIHLPAAPASGSAVVVAPGGSYAHLALDHEGAQLAR
jgi:hypothetical protein